MDGLGLLTALFFIFVLGILPLYIIVKLLGGKVSVTRALVIKIAAAVITVLLSMAFGWVGPLIVAVVLILLYRFAFDIGIIRAFLAWLLEGTVLAALIFLIGSLDIAVIHWDGIVNAFSGLASFL